MSTKFVQVRLQDPDTAIEVDVTAKTGNITSDQVFLWAVASATHTLVDKLEGMQQEQKGKKND